MDPMVVLVVDRNGKLHIAWGNDCHGIVKRTLVNNTSLGKHTITFELESKDKCLYLSYIP